MTVAVEQLQPRLGRSFGDIAEYLERTLKEKQSLERKLAEVLEENARLKSRTTFKGRQDAEFAVRERFLRDEFERKVQEIRLEVKKERRQLAQHVEKLEEELAGCFCRQST